ncbi:hypothetical protein ACHAWT_003635 [Skeletonema menzelii]
MKETWIWEGTLFIPPKLLSTETVDLLLAPTSAEITRNLCVCWLTNPCCIMLISPGDKRRVCLKSFDWTASNPSTFSV